MTALPFLALFAVVIVAAIASIDTGDHPTEQQQAMTDEWHAFLDTLPVLKEDPR